jgi:hypothetical protein
MWDIKAGNADKEVSHRVNVDGAASATGKPFRILHRYFAYNPAWLDVPRAVRNTVETSLCRTGPAMLRTCQNCLSSSLLMSAG